MHQQKKMKDAAKMSSACENDINNPYPDDTCHMCCTCYADTTMWHM